MTKRQRFLLASVLMTALVGIVMTARVTRTDVRAHRTLPTRGDAKTTFDSKCASCHGRDGSAQTARGKLLHARDLTEADWQGDVIDEQLFNSISNGKGKMPGFKKKLSETEIDALVAYVRRLKR